MEQPKNRILELRTARGWPQKYLASLIGSSTQQVSDLEKGKRRLNDDWIARLARAFDVPQADILPRSGDDDGLSPEERELIDAYRASTPAQRQQLKHISDVVLGYHPEPRRHVA